MAVYVVSDIHGYYDLFLNGLEAIALTEEDRLWVIGDAIDRGTDGIKLLQHIMIHENMDLILGNHEFMMVNSVDPSGEPKCTGADTNLWLFANKGLQTFEEYCKLPDSDRGDLLDWLMERSVIRTIEVNQTQFCLAHSFYEESCENKRYDELSYNNVWSVVWSSIWRDDNLTKAMDIYPRYPYTFITGHVPVQRIRRWKETVDDWNVLQKLTHGNLINIDGGCAFGKTGEIKNGAIFLRLDDMQEITVEMPLKEE